MSFQNIPSLTRNVRRLVLPNGLTVLLKENRTAPVAAISMEVKAGYFNEPDRWNGLAHVIEHMMFKGTAKRPAQEQIASEIRDLGGYVNAATYYEETSYYVVVPSKNLLQAMEIHADSVQNSLFDAEELRREIEVIVQESLQKRDNPNAMLIESLNTLAHDTHRIRRWRIGHPETLRGFTREDLVAFVDAYYRPANMILTLVGDFDIEVILPHIERLWGSVERGVFQPEYSPKEGEREEFRFQRLLGETRQRLVAFAFPVPDELHPDSASLALLSAVLSDGRSARLYRRLKEELQIASTAWASYEGFACMGLFRLGAESLADDPLEVEYALWEEVVRLQEELISQEELARVRTRIETRRLSAQEEVLGMARSLSHYEALGDYTLAESLLVDLQKVTPADIQRVAQTYFHLHRAALLEYLPKETLLPERVAQEVEARLHCAGQKLNAPTSVVFTPNPEIPKAISLSEGGKMLFQQRSDLPFVAMQVLFRGGKRNETLENSGITNLMLKATLKGTWKHSAEALANALESLGTGVGQTLGMDYFGYSLKLQRSALEEGFGYLKEILQEPAFLPQEIAKERQSIASEIRRQKDSIASLAMDLVATACYGEKHAYGLPSVGVLEAVNASGVEEVIAWHRRHVHAGNLFVGLVGDISEEEAVALFEGLLPVQESGEAENPLPSPAVITSPVVRSVSTQKQQTATAIAFPGTTLYDADRPALDVLTEIAAGMGGRFFRTVRGENALAYHVTCFHRSRRDAGNVIAYTSTAPENAEKARELLLAECRRFREEPVSVEELASAKASLHGEYVIQKQTFAAQAGEWGAFAIYGMAPEEAEHYLVQLNEVTVEDVLRVAQRYLTTDAYWLGRAEGKE
jgi:zinc protease